MDNKSNHLKTEVVGIADRMDVIEKDIKDQKVMIKEISQMLQMAI